MNHAPPRSPAPPRNTAGRGGAGQALRI